MKLSVKRWDTGAVIYKADAASLGELLSMAVRDSVSLWRANLRAADLRDANLSDADLRAADLRAADLRDANLSAALKTGTIMETGEKWGEYLRDVVPALLTAGGKALADVVDPKHWECHSWDNCPIAFAFSANGLDGVPLLLRPRAEQFIRYFDARLIPLEAVGKEPSDA